jgi:hypothetical protein
MRTAFRSFERLKHTRQQREFVADARDMARKRGATGG